MTEIRPLRAVVAIQPFSSREKADLESKLAGGGLQFPEIGSANRARLRWGKLIASGPGHCAHACVEQELPGLLPVGSTVLYEYSKGFEHYIDGVETNITESKMILACVSKDWGFRAVGWYALVRELAAEFEAHRMGDKPFLTVEEGSARDLRGKCTLRLHGGRVVSVGLGTYIEHRPHSPEVVRGWRGVQVGDRLAFSAQTATTLTIDGVEHFFASCAADIAGSAAYAW